MQFRVVMLTNGLPYGLSLLEAIGRRGARIAGVVCEARLEFSHHLVRSDSRLRRLVGVPKAALRMLRHLSDVRRLRRGYTRHAEEVVFTGVLNGERMRADLERLRPDFIILGGIGIIKEPLIGTARRGVLNAHPGLLPWIRGAGVVGRAVERGYPVGATCHYVNAGIDRGAIIERRLLPVTGREQTIAELEDAANRLSIEMLADLVAGPLSRGEVPAAVEQTEKHPLCRLMSAEEHAAAEAEVRRGRAWELFEGWRPACLDEETFRLPAGFDGIGGGGRVGKE